MDILMALLIGFLQGVTEWLPVSSEAVISLLLTGYLDSAPVESVNTALFLHSGTMFAALIYFKEEFMGMLSDSPEYALEFLGNPKILFEENLINFVGISTALTAVIGGTIYLYGLDIVSGRPEIFTVLIGIALIITGLMKLYIQGSDRRMENADFRDSIFVGSLQGFSVIPGISRSGVTVFGLLSRDFSTEDAFKLSFLLSVPAVIIGQIGIGIFSGFRPDKILILSAFTAFIVGYLSIGVILKMAERVEVAYICFILAFLAFIPLLV